MNAFGIKISIEFDSFSAKNRSFTFYIFWEFFLRIFSESPFSCATIYPSGGRRRREGFPRRSLYTKDAQQVFRNRSWTAHRKTRSGGSRIVFPSLVTISPFQVWIRPDRCTRRATRKTVSTRPTRISWTSCTRTATKTVSWDRSVTSISSRTADSGNPTVRIKTNVRVFGATVMLIIIIESKRTI